MTLTAILLVLAYSAAICLAEIPKMLREGQKRELWTFGTLVVLGITLSVLVSQGVDAVNPTYLINKVYSPLNGVMESLSK